LAELTETLCFQQAPLVPLLLDSRRTAFFDGPLGVDTHLAGTRERQAHRPVLAENDGLAPTVHPVIKLKTQGPGWPYDRVHAVPVGDLIHFLRWFQMLEGYIGQHPVRLLEKTPSGLFRVSSRHFSLGIQWIEGKKTPSKAALPLTVSDELQFRNGEAYRQQLRHRHLCEPIDAECLYDIFFYISVR
jgi:hypothetical protein